MKQPGIRNLFRNMKLQKKLLLSYLVVVIVPVTIIGYFFAHSMTEKSLKQDSYVNGINFQQTVNNINSFFSTYTQLSDNIKYDSQLTAFLGRRYDPGTDYAQKYFDFYGITNTYSTRLVYQSIDDVSTSIYTTNDQILHDNAFIVSPTDADRASEWYRQALDTQGLNNIGTPYLRMNKYMIPMSRLIYSDSLTTDVLKIEVPEPLLYRLFEKESANKTIYILNRQNVVVTSTNRRDIGKNLKDLPALAQKLSALPDSTRQAVVNCRRETIFADRLGTQAPLSECRIIDIVSTKSLMAELRDIINFSLVICLLAFLIDVCFIFLFSHQMTSRLKRLVSSMSRVRDGRFDITVSHDGTDEIDELSRSFEEMLGRIRTLINEVYTQELHVKNLEIKTKEAEIHALQSQINPHFLFNSLESIHTSVLRHRDFETADIIVSFSRLIRKSIDWKNNFIPLSQELELVEDYLRMQKFRFREKLRYRIEVDKRYGGVPIPKFTLQPFVENAIVHGIERLPQGGEVVISCGSGGRALLVTIRDNGAGIPPDTLSEIERDLRGWKESAPGSGIGIRNVNARLKMLYGEEYGVAIGSVPGCGAAVTVKLPLEQGNDGDRQPDPDTPGGDL